MAVTQGSISFLGINTNGVDWLAFVTLADLAAGDTIYFSDNELTTASATTFNTGESYSKWVAPTGGVIAGTVVVLNAFDSATPAATTGAASVVTFTGSTNRGLSATAESVYAYTAASDATANTPLTHLAYIYTGNTPVPATDGFPPASLPANLTLSFTDGRDGALFTGSHSNQTGVAGYLTQIANTANYSNPGATTTPSSALNATPFIVRSVSMLSAGDADRDSAVLIAKDSGAGTITFQVATDAAFNTIVVNQQVAVTDPLTPAKLTLANGSLAAGTQYFWRATDDAGATASASFRTADADGVRNGFSMGVTGDWRGELAPYPAIKNAATAGLDLFVKLGDTIYADYASPALNQPQAITLNDYLTKHNEVYSPRAGLDAWGDLQRTTAILSVIDDHEVTNDFAGGAPASSDARFGETTGLINDTPLYENGLTAFLAYNAIEDRTYANTGTAPRTDGEKDLYRYSQQGQDAAVYVLDARSFRDTELAPASSLTDPTVITNFLIASANPTRTMLGAAQLAQLKTDLLDAQAKGVIWKFIQIPEPIQNFGVLGAEDRFEGYAAERTEILKFIKDQGLTGVVFVSADIHGSVVNNLTYQDAPGGPQIAVAAWEITTGSVAFDAPFGQTVGALAGAAGLLTPQQTAFYNSLPVAPDTDSALNDKDDFIKGVINQQVTALGYDPIGLNANLSQTNGLIDATLNQGDYLVTHGYGWTRFDVDATTGDLTVTTYGVPYYSAADAAANPAAVAALNPTVQAQFTVRATINEAITGTAAGETLDGGGGNDTIAGLGGNDTITGGYGNDSIDGGAGADVVVFSGTRAAATIVNTGLGSWTVTTATGGTDTLKNVEQLQFSDGLYGGATLAANSGIDLSIYQLIGRYDLPEPTRTAAPANSLLAQEVSGVAYNWDTDTLFVVGDGGTSVVQVSKTGALINSMTLAQGSSPQGTEFYDPEGITYVGGGKFVITEERDRQLVQFTYAPGTTLTRTDAQTVKLGTTIGNIGFEGVSYDPQTGGFIVVKEVTPEGIFQTNVDFAAGTASNGSPTATGSTDLFNPALLGLNDIADVFALSNLTALGGLAQSGNLLVLSQEDGRIVNTDRAGNVTSSLSIVSNPGNPLSVANQQHEGLVVDADGTLYVVSENGGGDFDHPQLWVYRPSQVPNQAPTALALTNQTTTIIENSSTAARIKVADIAITDDGIGTNNLTVSGADAAFFEVDANGLYIRANTVLDFETKAGYAVTVNLDDPTLGTNPDATANFSLSLIDVVNENPAQPVLYISEVAPWSSGNSPVAVDWFEVTNGGTTAIDITGWKFDDNSNLFSAAVTLTGITSIAAGESVIFLETANLATVGATFTSTWFGASPPAGLRLGSYSGSGVGLSTGSDAVNLYNAAGVLQANVTFGASPASAPFATFNNAAGLNNTAITTLSAVGVNGAAVAVNDANEIGSPGTVGRLFISEVAPWSSGNSPVGADWFELTNTTGQAISITGWKIDDNSGSAAAAVALSGITSIAAGESVIFLESATPDTTRATFISTWFGGNAPAGLQIGNYTGGGVGLGTSGDAVNLYDGNNVLRASVSFGVSPGGPFASFDNAAGLNGVAISTLSAAGSNGAFAAAADAAEIGSPGTIRANPQLIIGTPGIDSLTGTAGNDTINGAASDDMITGGAGNDLIDGGAGSDTAVFSGSQAAYRFGFRDAVVIVSGADGTDQLSRVELLQFGAAAAVSIASLQGGAGDTGLVYANLGGRVGYVLPDAYTGPVAGLVNQLLGGTAGDVVLGTAQADFINGLGGDDAIDGGAGNDVIDGGLGSNFLTGGAGIDQFFVDGRGAATSNTWSTITDWQAGEALTLFGYQAGVSRFLWVANDGAAGYQGATLHADLDGSGLIDTSVTWTGLTQGQLPVAQFGADYVFFG